MKLASEQISEGGMFDIEYLYRATQLGEPVFKTRRAAARSGHRRFASSGV